MHKPSNTPCQDLIFASDATGSETDRAALAEHLAACPACASQAGRDAALARVWEATRPADPGEAAWETVWARVSERLDHAARPEPVPERLPFAAVSAAGRWRRYATSAFIVAQAAALLGAVVLWGAHRPTPDATVRTETPRGDVKVGVGVEIEIEPGELVLIHLEGETPRVVTLSHEEQRPDTLDESTVLFNDAEALAGMQEMFAEMHHNAATFPPPG
jgi:hypothetical protein